MINYVLAIGFNDRSNWPQLPQSITALVLFAVGLCLAFSVRLVAAKILEICQFNKLCERLGISEFLRKGQVAHTPARLIGLFAFWVILLSTLLGTLSLLGVQFFVPMMSHITDTLPAIISGIIVVIVGYVLVSFCANLSFTIAQNAGFLHAGLLAKSLRWLGGLLVFSLAVEQLGVEFRLIGIALQIILGATAFGLALAFGLGCKDMARDAMQKYLQHLREKQNNNQSDLEG